MDAKEIEKLWSAMKAKKAAGAGLMAEAKAYAPMSPQGESPADQPEVQDVYSEVHVPLNEKNKAKEAEPRALQAKIEEARAQEAEAAAAASSLPTVELSLLLDEFKPQRHSKWASGFVLSFDTKKQANTAAKSLKARLQPPDELSTTLRVDILESKSLPNGRWLPIINCQGSKGSAYGMVVFSGMNPAAIVRTQDGYEITIESLR